MSPPHTSIRTLFSVSIALLQLVLLPATQLLHLDCSHHGCAPSRSCSTGPETDHHCRCAHHSHNEQHPQQEDERHDPDNCPICRTVFAASMVESPGETPVCRFIRQTPPLRSSVVVQAPRFRRLSRGPPAC